MTDPSATIQEQRRHIDLLTGVSQALAAMSAAATPDEVASALLTSGLRVLDADAGYLAVLDDDGHTLQVSRFAGSRTTPMEHTQLDVAANLPIAYTVRSCEALFIDSNEDLAASMPGMERSDPQDHACASVPLRGATKDAVPLGAINVRFDAPRTISPFDRQLLEMLAARCSEAMLRAGRFDAEQRRRIAAEHALSTSRALEINDDIVQLLVEAKLAAELGRPEQAAAAIDRALTASKRVVATMTVASHSYRRDVIAGAPAT